MQLHNHTAALHSVADNSGVLQNQLRRSLAPLDVGSSRHVSQEDGLKKAVECFHDHLPLEDTQGKLPLTWELTKPHFGNFFSETGRGMTGFFSEPVRGFREGGAPHSDKFLLDM